MRFVLPSVTAALLALLHCHALPVLEITSNGTSEAMSLITPNARSANTCADPSLAEVMSRAFAPATVLHVLGPRWQLENTDTMDATAWFTNIEPIFQAWTSQQPFTMPLFSFGPSNGLDAVYMIGADASTPLVIPGLANGGIRAWVYDTPVCGSVPLMSVVQSAQSDHFWTTSSVKHDGLISAGWTDGGIIAYVLPLSTSN